MRPRGRRLPRLASLQLQTLSLIGLSLSRFGTKVADVSICREPFLKPGQIVEKYQYCAFYDIILHDHEVD